MYPPYDGDDYYIFSQEYRMRGDEITRLNALLVAYRKVLRDNSFEGGDLQVDIGCWIVPSRMSDDELDTALLQYDKEVKL